MCFPFVAVAMAALSAVQIVQQNRAAKEQAQAQTKAVTLAANYKQAALNQQATEANAAASESATAQQLEAARVASAAKVSAGEAGITGTGVNRVLGNIGQQAAQNLAITNRNIMGQVGQIRSEQEATEMNLQQNLSNIRAQRKASSVGPLEAVGRIAASYFGGANMASAFGAAGAAGAGAAGAGAAGAAGSGAAGSGFTSNFGALFGNVSNFLTPSDATGFNQFTSTGFSDEFASGDLMTQYFNRRL